MREHHVRLIALLAGVVLVTAWAPASAAAHAVVQPSAARPAELQRYTLTVPNERDVPTIAVRMEVPAGIDFFLAENTPGWTTHIEKRNGRIVAVEYEGGSIKPDFYDTFRFIVKNPVQEGMIVWNVRQSYSGGEVVEWTGPPDSDTPAARTSITESALAVDVVDVASGRDVGISPVATGDGGGGRLTLVLSCTALALALIGLAVALLRGRPLA